MSCCVGTTKPPAEKTKPDSLETRNVKYQWLKRGGIRTPRNKLFFNGRINSTAVLFLAGVVVEPWAVQGRPDRPRVSCPLPSRFESRCVLEGGEDDTHINDGVFRA